MPPSSQRFRHVDLQPAMYRTVPVDGIVSGFVHLGLAQTPFDLAAVIWKALLLSGG